MSYRHSRARRDFESQLALATKELAALYKFASKKGCGERLLAAYYVFAYSQLEVFIKTFVEDSIGVLNNGCPAFDKWPDLMLGYHLHKSENLAADYRRFSQDSDEGVILEKVAHTARKIGLWSTGAVKLRVADASDFLEKKKYPSPKNLPQLFRRLGVKQIWALVGKAGKINGEMILTSLNDLRTEIAHEGKVPLGFRLGDFRDRLNQMRRLVAALDRGVSKHFCSGVIPRADWNQAQG
jgi:hypothetical protein